jgi:hypothetical protein
VLPELERKELEKLYRELDAALAAAGPRCDLSGRCCRFREHGHMLFLSEMEAERLLEQPFPAGASRSEDGCPYQVDGLCTAREHRPLGCRVYFCDPTFAERQIEISESFIRRLKSLHEALGRAWRYQPLHAFFERKDVLENASPPTMASAPSSSATGA